VLINDSQISCSIARDTLPPCLPTIIASGDCESEGESISIQIIKNIDICEDDGLRMTIFGGETETGPYRQLFTLGYNDFDVDTTLFFSFVGDRCFVVTAEDTLGNVSEFSDPSCIEFCPAFELGNVFSPNGDGINDVFRPIVARDIVLREFVVFDRWGRMVYRNNTNLDALWSGEVMFSSRRAAAGVYYYYIRYEEQRLSGNIPREQKGWVTLME
jgi:gliding motility-associated-like protein